jgi:hypothetical protein
MVYFPLISGLNVDAEAGPQTALSCLSIADPASQAIIVSVNMFKVSWQTPRKDSVNF